MLGMLTGLRRYIANLRPPDKVTAWSDYADHTSYSSAEASAKRDLVQRMVREAAPSLLFDMGCNTGDYADIALQAGAKNVIGFDFDHMCLERAYRRFDQEKKSVLPILMDSANPSPAQGWAQRERMGLQERGQADALIALALVHHLAIGRNIPLAMVLDWLIGLAPSGVIEFPGKADPMVQRLLANRHDIFADYTEEHFIRAIESRGKIKESLRLSGTGRLLIWYERHNG